MFNNRTLTTQIKRTLHYTDYKVLFVGSIGIGLSFLWYAITLHPEIIYSSIFNHIKFTLLMSGIVFAWFIVMVIVMAIMRFYEPRVLEYAHLPKEIAMLKEVVINLGSYAATIDDKINIKKLGAVFLNIANEFKNIKDGLASHDDRIKQIETEVLELKGNDSLKDRVIARQNQDMFRLKWEGITLGREIRDLKSQLETYTNEKSVKEQEIDEKIDDAQNKKFEPRD